MASACNPTWAPTPWPHHKCPFPLCWLPPCCPPTSLGSGASCASLSFLGGPKWSSVTLCVCLPTAGLQSLQILVLHSNLLTSVPAGLAHLPLLTRLDLRDNQLQNLPPDLLDTPCVCLEGNPLGKALPAAPSPPGRLGVGRSGHGEDMGTVSIPRASLPSAQGYPKTWRCPLYS